MSAPTLATRRQDECLSLLGLGRCRRCAEVLPLSAFGVSKQAKNGINKKCRKCVSELSTGRLKRRRLEDPEGVRAKQREYGRRSRLKTKYGMTEEQFADMLARQGGCAICGVVSPERWVVDHDHATGAVRGVLCDHCNVGLGHFRDNPDLLVAAAAYLLPSARVPLSSPGRGDSHPSSYKEI